MIGLLIAVCLECILCPNNWVRYGDSCYHYLHTQKTWSQSREQCEEMGAHLPVIVDAGQQGFIQRFLTQQAEVMVWIGLQNDGAEWRWVNGQHFNTSLVKLKVHSGHCALVNKVGYYTGTCNSTYRLICQRKAMVL